MRNATTITQTMLEKECRKLSDALLVIHKYALACEDASYDTLDGMRIKNIQLTAEVLGL